MMPGYGEKIPVQKGVWPGGNPGQTQIEQVRIPTERDDRYSELQRVNLASGEDAANLVRGVVLADD